MSQGHVVKRASEGLVVTEEIIDNGYEIAKHPTD
jgi:hypothetical protein